MSIRATPFIGKIHSCQCRIQSILVSVRAAGVGWNPLDAGCKRRRIPNSIFSVIISWLLLVISQKIIMGRTIPKYFCLCSEVMKASNNQYMDATTAHFDMRVN